MITLLIYTFVPSNSYTQDAYICQQRQISIKPNQKSLGRDSGSKHVCCKGKSVTLSRALGLEGGIS